MNAINGNLDDSNITAGAAIAGSKIAVSSLGFSATILTQVNAGSAGGTMYYINLGGIKLCWGQTAPQTSSTGGNTYTITLPTSFFSTVQSVNVSANNQTVNGGQSVSADAISASSILYKQIDPGGTGTLMVSFFIIGT